MENAKILIITRLDIISEIPALSQLHLKTKKKTWMEKKVSAEKMVTTYLLRLRVAFGF